MMHTPFDNSQFTPIELTSPISSNISSNIQLLQFTQQKINNPDLENTISHFYSPTSKIHPNKDQPLLPLSKESSQSKAPPTNESYSVDANFLLNNPGKSLFIS